jgi:uncharacterized protein (DUF305 family)
MLTPTNSRLLTLLLVLAVAALGLVLSACGEDETDSGASGAETDAAFVAEMIPHHESAIEMAEIARKQAEHPEIKKLANAIVSTQSEEIETLSQISERLGDEHAGASLGMSEAEMGMHMDSSSLEGAEPFDQEFIDMMISHHQGAIIMAEYELANGSDDEAMALAEEIIGAQTREIEQMNDWREQWYGAPSPEGGVPDAAESEAADHDSMGH